VPFSALIYPLVSGLFIDGYDGTGKGGNLVIRMRDGQKQPQFGRPQPYHFCFVVVTRPEGQYQDTGLELSHTETVSHFGTLPGCRETATRIPQDP
jgi:hypothetical protein